MSYLSLEDYGLIGNQGSTALVSRLGSIDWCCFPTIDSPSHFGALLDESQGGRFQLMPLGDFRSEQRYLQRTHVLETLFETPHGRATLTDWMPMGNEEFSDPVIYRRIDVIQGRINWLLSCAPRFQYGREPGLAEFHRDGILFRGTGPGELARFHSSVPVEIPPERNSVIARFSLEAGRHALFAWRWGMRPVSRGGAAGKSHPDNPRSGSGNAIFSVPSIVASPRSTLEFWRSWAHRCSSAECAFDGPWHDSVTRSALVLKLLLNPEIGTIAESVTTSIPGMTGEGGHGRTWDYRFAWIRDAAAAIQALSNLGYLEECHAFFQWIADTLVRDGVDGLQTVYRIDGGRSLPERELPHLDGYQGARPVRVGNLSSAIFQLDVFGHVMLAASEYYRIFRQLPERLWPRLEEIANHVCSAWRRPDHGIWETRSRPEHFMSSKLFCWAALDRAIWLAEELNKEARPRWSEEREILHRTICGHGYDPALGSFVRSFGSTELDSSALLIPILGFLPVTDPRMTATMNAILARLSNGFLIQRCQGDDGMEGMDASPLISGFWMAQCMALAGRAEEATERLSELCACTTPLGLLGEQVDPAPGETTGNFPSARAHIQLINTALYVGAARGRQLLRGQLMGWNPSLRPAKSA